MTDEAKLTPRERAEAKANETVETATDYLRRQMERAIERVRAFEFGYEVVDTLPDLLEDYDVDVNWSDAVVFAPRISEADDTTPLLKELSQRGFHIETPMEVDGEYERLEWKLIHPDERVVKISADFDTNAKCRIEQVEIGQRHVEAHDVPIYETKVICDDEEQDEAEEDFTV